MTAPQTAPDQVPAIMQSRPVTALSQAAQEELEARRVIVQLAGAIAALSWGKEMDVPTRRSVAAYCNQYGIDPLTELDLLGGSLYLNADYWLRRLGELAAQGIVTGWELVHIQADERVRLMLADDKLPADIRERARKVWYDALFERIRRNAPEEAEAICICRIFVKGVDTPIEGCKWGGNGTSVKQPRRGGEMNPNPIVEENATLAVESQAVRRAMRQLASHMPAVVTDPKVLDEELARVSVRMVEARDAENAKRSSTLGNTAVGPSGDDGAYGLNSGQEVRALPLPKANALAGVDLTTPEKVAEMSDVLGEPGGYVPDSNQAALPLDTGEGEE